MLKEKTWLTVHSTALQELHLPINRPGTRPTLSASSAPRLTLSCTAHSHTAVDMPQALQPPVIDVAIIGGGPGGLAAALGLQAVSGGTLNVRVFDRAHQLRPIGACIGLAANGMNALAAINEAACDTVLASGIEIKGIERYDEFERLIARRSMEGAPPKDEAAGATRRGVTAIKWFDLQQALAQQLPAGVVQLGHCFKRFEESADAVMLHFDKQLPVQAKLVIGADGNTSAVRDALHPHSLQYTGVACWRTMVKRPESWAGTGWIRSFEGHRKLVATRSMGDYLTFSALAPWPEARLGEFKHQAHGGLHRAGASIPAERLQRFSTCFADFPCSLTELMHSGDPAQLLEHGVFYQPQDVPWGRGRITTVGDAAHVMPPNLGQGTSLALEDAHQLACSIAAEGVNKAALRHYEAARMPRIAHIADVVMKSKLEFYTNGNREASPLGAHPEHADIMAFIANISYVQLKALSPVVSQGSSVPI